MFNVYFVLCVFLIVMTDFSCVGHFVTGPQNMTLPSLYATSSLNISMSISLNISMSIFIALAITMFYTTTEYARLKVNKDFFKF